MSTVTTPPRIFDDGLFLLDAQRDTVQFRAFGPLGASAIEYNSECAHELWHDESETATLFMQQLRTAPGAESRNSGGPSNTPLRVALEARDAHGKK